MATEWGPEHFDVSTSYDGSVVLTCGNGGMETDLVFAAGAMTGDSALDIQRAILEHIVAAVKFYHANNDGKTTGGGRGDGDGE